MADDRMKERASVGTVGRAVLDYVIVVNLAAGLIKVEPRAAVFTGALHLLPDLLEQTVRRAELFACANLDAGNGDVPLAVPIDLDRRTLARALNRPLTV